ncbi:MAG: ATP-dependent Clp protease proteolytic subunit [Leptospiraceae bacterium]|nr:ATP-dependent Clp protease proteolytic subunit [Leptospiraceae bacterium]MCB1200428.1 ATP-dependent Clp protease proteolytic subunit [Leptospiraceae bacterium]
MNQDLKNPFLLDEDPDEEAEPKKTSDKKEGVPAIRERIGEQFLNRRQIFLWGAVSDKTAEAIVAQLMFLENSDPGKPIYFFINSPGGVITSGMAVYDVMKMITSPVYTITMGMAASMGAILLCAGEKGHRYVFPHAKVMIHQPLISGQIVAPAIDIKIHATEIKKTRNEMNRILAEATGHSIEKIEKDTDRDYYLNGEEAVKYGIADKMLTDFSQIQAPEKKPEKKASPKKKSGK